MPRATPAVRLAAALHLVAVALIASACTASPEERQREAGIEPVYDEATGRLQQLKYDSNKNGTIDMVSFMDGARLIRVEIDKDEDGKVERWEYFGADQKLEKVGFSRANDGKEDAWSFARPSDGTIERIDISTARDGKVTRREYYESDALVRAEDDGDGDGRTDKWETYDAGRLAIVAFDTAGRGTPDRRFVYARDGSAVVEFDPEGDGTFTAARK